jgi:hypothetical protein
MKNLLLLTFFLLAYRSGVFCQLTKSDCPTISMITPAGVTMVGETMFFRVDVSDNSARHPLRYKWEVLNGEITDGQGSDQIRVIAKVNGVNVTVSVRIKGLPKQCENSASEIAPVAIGPSVEPVEDYGEIPWDEERARLDNIMIILLNNPKSQAFFYVKIAEKETKEDAKKHITEILKHFKFRDPDFDRGRLTFALEKSEYHGVVVGIFPDGADLPDCQDCEVINGRHIYF